MYKGPIFASLRKGTSVGGATERAGTIMQERALWLSRRPSTYGLRGARWVAMLARSTIQLDRERSVVCTYMIVRREHFLSISSV